MDRLDFDNQLDNILIEAESLIPNKCLPDLPFMAEAPDVHDWYKFESELWGVGENIRQLTIRECLRLNGFPESYKIHLMQLVQLLELLYRQPQ